MFDLTGKKALVTGATGGLGRATAQALYQQGASVGLSGTRAEVLEALQDELGERAVALPADLGAEDGPAELAGRAEEALGGVDILINNAGITRDNLAMRLSDDDWQAVLAVNLTAPFRLARALLRGMMKRRAGRIIGITSIVGATGNAGQSNYAAAKAGMTGMSKSLAAEVASRGITVNCIAPGFIETAMTDTLADQQKDAMLKAIPMGRFGAAAEIAAAAVFLASDEAGYITGTTVHVNGGMAML